MVDLAACLKLGRGDDLIGTEQSQHRLLQLARHIRTAAARQGTSQTTAPAPQDGRARRRPIATTRSRSWSLSASKT